MTDPDNHDAEFGIIVRSDLKRRGLGRLLLDKMIRYCRSRGRGTLCLVGDVLAVNTGMLELASSLGFETARTDTADVMHLRLPLQP